MFIKYFTNKTNAFEKDEIKEALQAANVVFGDQINHKYRALIYIRQGIKGVKYFHITCPELPPRMLGSHALAELCDDIKSTGITLDKTNQFYEQFNM